MSRVYAVTGKKPLTGNHVSHANNRTKRRQLPNLQKKRIYITELKKWVTVRLTARAMRTISKKGALITLREAGLI